MVDSRHQNYLQSMKHPCRLWSVEYVNLIWRRSMITGTVQYSKSLRTETLFLLFQLCFIIFITTIIIISIVIIIIIIFIPATWCQPLVCVISPRSSLLTLSQWNVCILSGKVYYLNEISRWFVVLEFHRCFCIFQTVVCKLPKWHEFII